MNDKNIGNNRIDELMSLPLLDNNLLPKPVSYEDMDIEITDFMSKNVNLNDIGLDIKSFFLSQQRMSEFTKTWEMLDENKNIIPNFVIVTRENNPKPGNLQGGLFNIPGDVFFKIGTFNKWDGNKNITVSYKIKQPYCVDVSYNIKFVTNKITILNEMNSLFVDLFKSRQLYLFVNGHYMPMVLEDVGDDSDYDLEQRKIFIQNYKIKLYAYIIKKSDIIEQENTVRFLVNTDLSKKEYSNINYTDEYVDVFFDVDSKTFTSFKFSEYCNVQSVQIENVLDYKILVNDKLMSDEFELNKHNNVFIKINRIDNTIPSKIRFIKSTV